ncbi:MAG TPA: nuclear transport factor 2 family protein [Solirubrobacteraceae bacterium]|nr:nuclear transport factor 2 family protein [Solirubrobacteraceae bacterium]
MNPAIAPSIEWTRELVASWLDAWNSHQPDRLLELLTDDVEARDDSWPKAMHGHGDVREFAEALWRAVPDMTFELVSGPYVIPDEPRASFHWRGTGTFTGRMDPPGFAPTGRRWEIDGADFHEYRDGRISRLRVVFDLMSVSRQLGVMPPTGSRAERAMAAAQRALVRAQQMYRQRPS